jgi:hypothetical protein
MQVYDEFIINHVILPRMVIPLLLLDDPQTLAEQYNSLLQHFIINQDTTSGIYPGINSLGAFREHSYASICSLNFPEKGEIFTISGLDTDQTPASIEWTVTASQFNPAGLLQAIAGRFPTQAVLYQWGLAQSPACRLCGAQSETMVRLQCWVPALKERRIRAHHALVRVVLGATPQHWQAHREMSIASLLAVAAPFYLRDDWQRMVDEFEDSELEGSELGFGSGLTDSRSAGVNGGYTRNYKCVRCWRGLGGSHG